MVKETVSPSKRRSAEAILCLGQKKEKKEEKKRKKKKEKIGEQQPREKGSWLFSKWNFTSCQPNRSPHYDTEREVDEMWRRSTSASFNELVLT